MAKFIESLATLGYKKMLRVKVDVALLFLVFSYSLTSLVNKSLEGNSLSARTRLELEDENEEEKEDEREERKKKGFILLEPRVDSSSKIGHNMISYSRHSQSLPASLAWVLNLPLFRPESIYLTRTGK